MELKLNTLLSDLVVEYHKLQNFHWYAKGRNFFDVHLKLEELYTAINVTIDEVAETMLMVGFSPVGSLKEFSALSKITEATANAVPSEEIYNAVLADYEYLLQSIKDLKRAADSQEEYLISSSMDNYIAQFSKTIWMLKQLFS